jgi:hypothetical protein
MDPDIMVTLILAFVGFGILNKGIDPSVSAC